jgi:hypothetical protein
MTMSTLRVNDILKDKVLVSRESARLLEDPLRTLMSGARSADPAHQAMCVTVDFTGVGGIAPSFLDELVTIFESLIGTASASEQKRLVVKNPPTRLSSKFEAVARGHGLVIQAQSDSSWVLTGAPA